MAITMAGHLVALGDDVTHQLWVTLGNPTQGEKGCFHLLLGQHAQDPLDIALDAALASLPIDALDVGRKGRDLKIVFDIDRQRIRKGGGQHDPKILSAR